MSATNGGTINAPLLSGLSISLSHSGTFTQGDAADTYTVLVTNISTSVTSGAVTVVDTLPTGLTSTAADNATINGWTVTTTVGSQTITATRSDALSPNKRPTRR